MILGWDSSGMTCQIYLINGDEIAHYEWPANRQLAHDMLAYLRDRLAEHDLELADITGIIAKRGPGSYTGLRIGLTVLNTLAESLNIPIVGEIGENWLQTGRSRLGAGQTDSLVMPEYGGDAHVTTPKK